MRRIPFLLLPVLALAAVPAAAQEIAYAAVSSETAVRAAGIVTETVELPAPDEELADEAASGGARLIAAAAPSVPQGVAAYGPFRVLDDSRAALVDVTDGASPAAFAAMLREHPGIATLEMVACPGTEDDRANLRLGALIRAGGLTTHVPDGGYVGSGAVELFLAGLHRFAEPSAQFAVHSWQDESGREAGDYPLDAPENRAYLDYYEAVGMTDAEARAFYAMTNSVPFAGARWLTRAELAQWVPLDTRFPKLDLLGALQ